MAMPNIAPSLEQVDPVRISYLKGRRLDEKTGGDISSPKFAPKGLVSLHKQIAEKPPHASQCTPSIVNLIEILLHVIW